MADAAAIVFDGREVIATNESIFVAQSVVDPAAEVVAGLGGDDTFLNAERLQGRVEDSGVDDGIFFDVAAFHVEAERGAFIDGPTEATAEEAGLVGGFVGGKRVARVERLVREVEECVAAELVGTGLREDLDAAEADAIELGGVGVLIDADFADGRFGRDAAAGEAVDENLTAVGSGTGAGEGLELLRELVGVVGEGFQLFGTEDEGTGVLLGIGGDSTLLVLDLQGLRVGGQGEANVERRRT